MKYILIISFIFAFSSAEKDIYSIYKTNIARSKSLCMRDYPVDIAELHKLNKGIVPDNKDVKCLLACAYKREGTMTEDGFYNTNRLIEISKQVPQIQREYGAADHSVIKHAQVIARECSRVNSANVPDGNEGCERAALIFKCILKNAKENDMNVY